MTDKKHNAGFTLIELMVVMGIIAILSSVVISTLSAARIRSQDLIRVQNLVTLRNALELYYADNKEYPKTFESASAFNVLGECANPGAYIPNLTPKYIAVLPTDPTLNCGSATYSFRYASNGTDYKLITHPVQNSFPAFKEFPANAGWNGHYGVWSQNAVNWGGL